MIAFEPSVQASARYSTAETAALLNVNRSTIFRYVEQGLLKPGYRKATKRRFYTGAEILRFWGAKM